MSDFRECAVPGCNSNSNKLLQHYRSTCAVHKKLHAECLCYAPFRLLPFPQPPLADAWAEKIWPGQWMNTSTNNTSTNTSTYGRFVCSKHFVNGKPSKESPHPILNLDAPAEPTREQKQDVEYSVVQVVFDDQTLLDNGGFEFVKQEQLTEIADAFNQASGGLDSFVLSGQPPIKTEPLDSGYTGDSGAENPAKRPKLEQSELNAADSGDVKVDVYECCVIGCTTHVPDIMCPRHQTTIMSCPCQELTLHSLPPNEKDRDHWLTLINRAFFIPDSKTRVCSKHFIQGMPSLFYPAPTLNLGYEYPRSDQVSAMLDNPSQLEPIITLKQSDDSYYQYACPACKTGGNSPRDPVNHLTASPQCSNACNICQTKFEISEGFVSHMKIHIEQICRCGEKMLSGKFPCHCEPRTVVYVCKMCPFRSYDLHLIRKHLEAKH